MRTARGIAAPVALVLAATVLVVPGRAKAAPAAPSTADGPVVSARADEQAALSAARMTGKKVQIADRTSETATFWALPSGAIEAEVYAAPVRVRDAGGWRPVDLTLVRQADGSVAATAHPAGLRLSGKAGAGRHDLVQVGTGDRAATMSWSGPLPEPVLDGAKATYPRVRPGVDLVVEATRTGFAQFLVVHDSAAVAQVRSVPLSLSSKGLRFEPDGRGGFALKDRRSGARVGASPAPLMWDAQRRVGSGEPVRVAAVKARATARSGRTDLLLTPDVAWLTNPATRYPVTIDPSVVLSAGFDTFVQSDVTDDRSGQGILKFGTQDGGTVVSRSFLTFPGLDWLWGKQVQSATLRLWNELSTSCTAAEWQAWRVGPVTNAVRWSAQPAWLAQVGASTETKGFSAACADGWVGVPVTGALQHLAAGGTDGTAYLGLRATSETDSNGWKRFDSTEAGNPPHIQLTYHTAPSVNAVATNPWAPCVTGSARPYLSSATPRLRAQVSDPDASPVQAKFEWWAVGGSAAIGSATTAAGPSGSWRVVDVPSAVLANNGSYQWRAQGYDGAAWGAWSGWCEFTVDTTVPASMPTVTSTDYPEAPPAPAGGAHTAGTFTLGAAGVTDVAAYLYGLDVNPPTKRIAPAALGGSVDVSVTPKTDGPHVLYVRSRDRAGNLSPVRAYAFLVGPGGIVTPVEGDVTAAKVNLTVQGHPTSTGVRYQWRRAETDTWVNIPLANVTYTVGGGAVASWPVASTGAGAYPAITWDVAATLAAADAASVARDGPLYLRAVFAGLTATNAVEITFDQNLATADTTPLGPGAANLITGNYTVNQSDVQVGGLSVGRTFNTRQAGRSDAMFGPGWASGITVGEAAAPYTQLNAYGSLVQVGLPDDTTIGFTQQATTGTGATFHVQNGTSGLSLVYTTSGDSYTLTDRDGNVVTFTRQATDPAGQYMPTSATPPGSGSATTYSWEQATVGGQTVTRPTRVLAPVPAGVTCGTTLVKGCRALTFTYATTTTATGVAEAAWGDYAGRVKEVSFVAWDPDLATPAMRTVVLARYAYDNAGKLRASWDPRLDWLDGATTRHLWQRYAYDADGILTTITPAGQEPWQLTYTTLPTDAGKGRLHKVTRSALSAGTAVNTVVYQVPISGSGSAYDLSAGQTARWGQTAPPVDATAVYPATQVPSGNPATGTLPSSYERASLTYLNANGRTVNSVAPGGHVSSTWYDEYGDVVRELSPANRARALDSSASDSASAEATLAEALSEVLAYSADGVRLLDTFGPEHDVALPDGSAVRGRTHTAYTYDEGLPAGQTPPNLVTTTTTTVQYGDGLNTDARTTKTEYSWALRQPTVEIVDPSGLNLRTRTSYDGAGVITAHTTPAGGAVDTTPATRVVVYYTTAANATYPECGNHAEWAGSLCRAHPGGQPGSGPELLATVTTYDMYGQPRVQTEKTSAGVQRTTTVVYDSAGRQYETVVTTASGLGEPLERRRNVYDASTGLLTRTQTVNAGNVVTAQVIRAYDTLGRVVSYTDADGNVSTTTYDVMSRTATTNDGKATQTYTYDGGSERRGLPTQIVDSQAGTFTAQYDADGRTASQSWPNGVSATVDSDETGATVSIGYVYAGCGSADCTLYYESAANSVHGQARVRTSTLSAQKLGYDQAGRLTSIGDAVGSAACVTRAYTYSTASNRTGLTTYGPDAGGGCQTTTSSSTTTWTYDTADRLITAGTSYDALGRTTTIAASDTTSGAAATTVAYYADDTVRQLTQGSAQTSYTADVINKRIRNAAAGGTTAVKTFHYSGDTDNPVWTDEDGWYSRIVPGFSSVSGVYSSAASQVAWKITNLHGDLVATILDPAAGIAAVHEPDEHGLSRSGATLDQRYGYLGAALRPADNPGGLITMGARLYNPDSGRFLSTDPVYAGNANPYDYCVGDSVNCADPDGQRRKKCYIWGCKLLFNKSETRFIDYWLHDWVLESWVVHGSIAAAVLFAAKRLVPAALVALLGPYLAIVAAVLGAWLWWVGSQASRARDLGRCLQISYVWGTGIAGGVPGTYRDGCK
ncbi:DNRLRE domain-containing protein [Phytohabitans rumicis]|uniref:Carbohydrate-binding module family 96 domain-containing protein n=1 Tax=Phytohabitans rumicis TaxID=1076125 RepID=A0A6V8KW75_9ACTN|nr:DNRLRE domain-containing protein [Phytohabitans rumicis]GFJ86559.1 hypothetical protein Prum_002010 [Phytohabitans rumicis]